MDTSVWSLALRRRRRAASVEVDELRELIREVRAAIIGPVRQEILSGIREPEHYDRLRDKLRAFVDLDLETADFELAAAYLNECRRKGVQGSNTDFLICAVASRRSLPVFTTDPDFTHFAAHVPVAFHEPRGSSGSV